jgi:hypothetical protein
MFAAEPATPSTDLANLILALLAPMFLWSTNGDIRLAYAAAAQTVTEYRVTNRLSLFTVAKIIAFDIASLSSLSLSMYEDVSMLLALRLRGNANSLDRSGERNRRALEATRQSVSAGLTEEPVEAAIAKAEQMVREAKTRLHAASVPAAEPRPNAAPAPAAEPAAVAAPAPVLPAAVTPAPRTAAAQRRAAWANAMTVVAEEFTAGLKDLAPEERRKEMARITALTTTAGDLVSRTASPPAAALAAE